MNLPDLMAEALKPYNLSLARFQEIVARAYAWGIILRDEGATEQRLYDDAQRIEPLLRSYFALGGFRLVHDQRTEYFRLYPPGAHVPGDADEPQEAHPALRARLSADVVAAAIALRFLYQKGLADGTGELTERGDMLCRLDELTLTLQTQLRRSLPEGLSDRERLLRELRRHRLIAHEPGFSLENEEAVFLIRAVVLSIVSDDAVQAALGDGESVEATDVSEDTL